MSEKKYAIIRVDNKCPQEFEKIDIEYICRNSKCFQGEKCRRRSKKFYGDSKEQLIKKVMTAFKIAIKKNKEGKFVKEKSNNRQVAEIIVEFLGIME